MKSSLFPAKDAQVLVGMGFYPTAKIHKALQKKDKKFFSYFTPHEKAYCFARKRAAESFAARLAAKQAFWDALEIRGAEEKFKPSEWREVGVERKRPGPPALVVKKSLLKKLNLPSQTDFLLSITHERAFAMTVVAIQLP